MLLRKTFYVQYRSCRAADYYRTILVLYIMGPLYLTYLSGNLGVCICYQIQNVIYFMSILPIPTHQLRCSIADTLLVIAFFITLKKYFPIGFLQGYFYVVRIAHSTTTHICRLQIYSIFITLYRQISEYGFSSQRTSTNN